MLEDTKCNMIDINLKQRTIIVYETVAVVYFWKHSHPIKQQQSIKGLQQAILPVWFKLCNDNIEWKTF